MPKQSRPVDINLFAFHFPVTAIGSIMHRISGFLLVCGIPLLIWLWQFSLASAASYAQIKLLLQIPAVAFVLWGFASLFFYHLVAGVKHLAMDLGWGEGLRSGRILAWLVLCVSIIFSLSLFYLLVVQ